MHGVIVRRIAQDSCIACTVQPTSSPKQAHQPIKVCVTDCRPAVTPLGAQTPHMLASQYLPKCGSTNNAINDSVACMPTACWSVKAQLTPAPSCAPTHLPPAIHRLYWYNLHFQLLQNLLHPCLGSSSPVAIAAAAEFAAVGACKRLPQLWPAVHC